MGWMHHQSMMEKFLLQRQRSVLHMYRRLSSVRVLSFVYPSGLVRDWSMSIVHKLTDVSIRCSAVQRLVNRRPSAGSAQFQIVIDRYFGDLQARWEQWVAGERAASFHLYNRCVEDLFNMGAVFAILVHRYYTEPVHTSRSFRVQRCLVANRWLVPVYDPLRGMIEIDFVCPASFVERWCDVTHL